MKAMTKKFTTSARPVAGSEADVRAAWNGSFTRVGSRRPSRLGRTIVSLLPIGMSTPSERSLASMGSVDRPGKGL